MKDRQESEILEEFLRVTKAQLVRPTEEEEIERLELEAETERRMQDTERLKAHQAEREIEEAALREVRDQVVKSAAQNAAE